MKYAKILSGTKLVLLIVVAFIIQIPLMPDSALSGNCPLPNPPEWQAHPSETIPHVIRKPMQVEPDTEWTYHKTADGSHPDGNEQQMMWLMNRARANPTEEGIWLANLDDPDVVSAITNVNVDLETMKAEFAAIPPVPPAAFDLRLYNAAYAHSQFLISCNCQSHYDQDVRVNESGFQWSSLKGNVFSYANSAIHCHAALNIDWIAPGQYNDGTGMQTGRGHRIAIMSINRSYSNVGIAMVPHDDSYPNVGPLVMTGNYAAPFNGVYSGLPPDHYYRFIVGTVWADNNQNGIYDPGEGIGGVSVMPDHGKYYAITGNSGGYSVPITEPGIYQVTFSGSVLPQDGVLKQVELGDDSVLSDINTLAPVAAAFSASVTKGPSPLTVNFTDQSTGIVSQWSWNFGDSGSSTQANPVHSFTNPGIYTITLTATGGTDTDSETKTGYISVAPQEADVNGDNYIDLEDVIITLQTIANEPPSSPIRSDGIFPDIDGNGKLGIEEAIYILEWISMM